MVDTLGLIWGICITSGNTSEAAGAKKLLLKVQDALARWEVIWVDGGFEHRLEKWVEARYPFRVEVVKRSDGKKGWELLPKRWVSERTFGWLGRWRALAREYDYRSETTEANILLAMTHLMLRRLTV